MEHYISSLYRRDLMELEPLLRDSLYSILPFSAHALYFPQEDTIYSAEWLPRERKLLLPLRRNGFLLGVFMMSGVRSRQVKPLLPVLPAVATLALDKLAWHKASLRDNVTGLLHCHVLLARMTHEAELVRARLHGLPDVGLSDMPTSCESGQPHDLHRLCMGLVTLRCDNLSTIIRRQGHTFADTIMCELSAALLRDLPSDVSAARSGEEEFTLLLPTSGRTTCHRVAEAAMHRMSMVNLQDAITQQPVRPCLTGGQAVYPQDMQGAELALPMFEQTHILLDRARMATHIAGEKLQVTSRDSALPYMDFARILHVGGVVREILPGGRVRVSLGCQAGACEGMRFTVWEGDVSGEQGTSPRYKGEIVLLDVQEITAIAETIHVIDPAWSLACGDVLTLLSAADSPHASGGEIHKDPLTGLLQHGDFLRTLSASYEEYTAFTLSVLRISPQESTILSAAQLEQSLPEVVRVYENLCEKVHLEEPRCGGRYGSHGLVFLHTEVDINRLCQLYHTLSRQLYELGLDIAVGLASYPCMQFSKTEILACALKALDCAMLMPSPHVSVCDSLAFNVSADRHYSLGDVFGAVEEYKLALLANDGNATAWNSLGVCMATMGQTEQARRYFSEAQKRAPQDPAVAYNMGTLYQTLHNTRAASRYFKQCLKLDPQHFYAHIRLGQLAEQGGRRKLAKQYFQQAANIEADQENTGIAWRHLARMALLQKRGTEARELLHDTLLKNPYDAVAMRMLAALYLDGGEDPAMAELLARKSVCVQPTPQGWKLLARALRALGREEDSLRAESMAG